MQVESQSLGLYDAYVQSLQFLQNPLAVAFGEEFCLSAFIKRLSFFKS